MCSDAIQKNIRELLTSSRPIVVETFEEQWSRTISVLVEMDSVHFPKRVPSDRHSGNVGCYITRILFGH